VFGSPLYTSIALLLLLIILRVTGHKVTIILHGVLYASVLSTKNNTIKNVLHNILVTYYRIIANLSKTLIVLNYLQKKLLVSYGISPQKIMVIPLGAERCSSSAYPNNNEDSITIFFHGFIRTSKGLLELVEAVKLLLSNGMNVKLKILGQLHYNESNKKIAIEYFRKVAKEIMTIKDNVSMNIGIFPREKLLEEAMKSDIIVLPYTDNYIESSGVLHLFMDCGRPIIVSKKYRFLADVVPNKEVLAVDVNPRDIAIAISSIISNMEHYRSFAKELQKKASQRYWDHVAMEYLRSILFNKS
jgi:glycosyltransferase involved in cell wall biosynthesis